MISDVLTAVGGETVSETLREVARRHADDPFLIFQPRDGEPEEFSWAEFDVLVDRATASLIAAGARPGCRIHLHLPNSPQFLIALFACARSGSVAVPTNPDASADELSYLLGHAEVDISVVTADTADVVTEAGRRSGAEVTLIRADRGELEASDPTVVEHHPAPSDLLAYMYTSGTTARPKAVGVTNANYLFAGEVVSKHARISSDDRIQIALPLFHANAQYYGVMSALRTGATVILADRFSASGYFPCAIRHGATVASLFAAPIRMLLRQPEDPQWLPNRLRLSFFAQNLRDAEHAEWKRRTGVPLVQIYGMTETIGPPLMNPIEEDRARPHSIGRVTLGYACRVVDERGDTLQADVPGELWVRGDPGVSLMAGYQGDEAATAEAIVDGWLRTGDIVAYDQEGFFRFVDRSKDMVKRSGENVAASEVERVLLEHDAVAEVAVFGVPDDLRDEAIVAAVVPATGTEVDERDLIAHCEARLSRFRVPSHIYGVERLPATSVGKIAKHRLRDVFLERWDPGQATVIKAGARPQAAD